MCKMRRRQSHIGGRDHKHVRRWKTRSMCPAGAGLEKVGPPTRPFNHVAKSCCSSYNPRSSLKALPFHRGGGCKYDRYVDIYIYIYTQVYIYIYAHGSVCFGPPPKKRVVSSGFKQPVGTLQKDKLHTYIYIYTHIHMTFIYIYIYIRMFLHKSTSKAGAGGSAHGRGAVCGSSAPPGRHREALRGPGSGPRMESPLGGVGGTS